VHAVAAILLASAFATAKPSDDAAFRARGVLRYATDPSGGAPYAMLREDDPSRLTGFEIELMELVGRELGVAVEPVRGDWVAIPDLVRTGRVDLGFNGFETTSDRAAVLDFTVPYFVYDQQPAVRAADRARFRSLADLRGAPGRPYAPVATLDGAATVEVLAAEGWPTDAIRVYDDSLTPFEELRLGRVDAVVQDSIIVEYYAGGDADFVLLPPLGRTGTYAGIVRKGDDATRLAVDGALETLKRTGEMAAVYRRWRIWSDAQRTIGVVDARDGSSAAEGGSDPAEEPAPDAAASRARFSWPAAVAALARAGLNTVLLTALAMPLAVVAGLLLAIGGRAPNVLVRRASRCYVAAVRGTPLLVQLYLVYFSLPVAGAALAGVAPSLDAWIHFQQALTWPAFLVAVVVLAGNYGAYEAEVQRAGLESVPAGQRRAALALGMSSRQALWRIEVPQGFRAVLPATINDLNSMIKDSSLVSLIAVPELMQVALSLGKGAFMVPTMLVVAAGVYLALSVAGDRLANAIARRTGLATGTLRRGGGR
jgi:polar amino acid transport system substrate-binding protein